MSLLRLGGAAGRDTALSAGDSGATSRLTYQYFRVLIFAAHATTAILFMVYAFTTGCTQIVSASYFETTEPMVLPGWSRGGVPPRPGSTWMPTVVEGVNAPCPDLRVSGGDVGVGGLFTVNRTTSLCYAMQPLVSGFSDQQEDVRGFAVGSSWNALVLILVFEWLTASYALLYLQEPAFLWRLIPMPPGVHPVPAIATLWNLALVVILWLFRNTLMVPDNNLFLFSLQTFATIAMQNYLARPGPFPAVGGDGSSAPSAPVMEVGNNGGGRLVETTTVTVVHGGSTSVRRPVEWKTDHFLHQRKRMDITASSSARYSSLATLDGNAGGGDDGNAMTLRPDVPLHGADYAFILDDRGEAVAARMMEYSVTAPLLLVGMFLNYTNASLTWTYQILLLSLCACNGFGILLHYAVLLLRSAQPADRVKLQVAGWLALAGSWVSFWAGFTVFIHTASYFLFGGASGMPSWVVMLLWSVIILYAMFGIIITYFYVPRLWDPTPEPTKPDERDPWFKTFDWAVFCLDILSLSVKLAVAWTVYSKGSVVNCMKPGVC